MTSPSFCCGPPQTESLLCHPICGSDSIFRCIIWQSQSLKRCVLWWASCVCVCVRVCVRERERETDRQTQRNLTDFIGSKAQFWPKWMLTLLSNSLFIASIWPNAGELKSELALPQHLVQTPRLRFPPQKGNWDSKLAESPSNNSLHCLTLQKHSHVPWEPCWKIHSVFKLNR